MTEPEQIEDVLSERVCKAIDRRVADVLRTVANVIFRCYDEGHYGHGGPQDGPDSPPSFDGRLAYRLLNDKADELDEGKK